MTRPTGDQGANSLDDWSSAQALWWESLCAHLALFCKSDSQELIERLGAPPEAAELAAAVVIVGVCRQVREGVTHSDIAAWLGTLIGDDGPTTFTFRVVAAIAQAWQTFGVPIPQWWDVELLLISLADHLIRTVTPLTSPVHALHFTNQRLPPGYDIDETPEKIGAVIEVLDTVSLPESPPVSPEGEPWAPVQQTYLSTLGPEAAADASWLLDAAQDGESWRVLSEARYNPAVDHVRRLVESKLAEYEVWRSVLTPLERSLIEPVDDRQLRLARWLRHSYLQRIDLYLLFAINGVEPGARTPDDVPQWVAEQVFRHGGRFIHGSSGPVSYWMAVVEDDLEEELAEYSLARGFGVALIEEGSEIRVLLQLGDSEADPYYCPYYFDLSDAQSAMEFAVACLGGIRLDLFRLRDESELGRLGTVFLPLPTQLLDRYAAMIDETLSSREPGLLGDDPRVIQPVLPEPEEAAHWFISTDHAKSEALLTAIALIATDDRELLRAHRTAASCELDRVTAELDGTLTDEIDNICQAARRDLRVTASRSERVTRQAKSSARLAAIEEVVIPGRAFVHFLSSDGTEKVCLAYAERAEVRFEVLDDANADTAQISAMAEDWLAAVAAGPEGEDEAEEILKRLLHWVGALLIRPLVLRLLALPVEHVVLCPSQALEPLPLHAARLGNVALQDFFDVSYAPNVRAVSLLSGPRLPLDLDLIVCADGSGCPESADVDPAAGIASEGRILRRLAPSARVLSGGTANVPLAMKRLGTSRVAHLMAHGRVSDDRLASGLWLHGTTAGGSLLSAALVEAERSLTGLDLVVLSACQSSAFPVSWTGIQAWRGLDAAFLAQGVSAVVGTLWPVDDLAALIYGQELHLQLSDGVDVLTAHHRAVNVLRTGEPGAASEAALDQERPAWREELATINLESPYWWAPFRLSGRLWPGQPTDREARGR